MLRVCLVSFAIGTTQQTSRLRLGYLKARIRSRQVSPSLIIVGNARFANPLYTSTASLDAARQSSVDPGVWLNSYPWRLLKR